MGNDRGEGITGSQWGRWESRVTGAPMGSPGIPRSQTWWVMGHGDCGNKLVDEGVGAHTSLMDLGLKGPPCKSCNRSRL